MLLSYVIHTVHCLKFLVLKNQQNSPIKCYKKNHKTHIKCVLWSVLLYFDWCILLVFKNKEPNVSPHFNIFSVCCETPMFKPDRWPWFWNKWLHSTTSRLISLKSHFNNILLLLRKIIRVFYSGCKISFCNKFSSLLCVLHVPPILFSLFW
jgi:hypothetical protein